MNYRLPFSFVLRYLYPVRPTVKRIAAGYALYYNQQLLLILRDKEDRPEFNGVFVATRPEFFAIMQKELHTSPMEFDLDGSIDSWIFISEDLPEFDKKVKKACEMIKSGDPRIGIAV